MKWIEVWLLASGLLLASCSDDPVEPVTDTGSDVPVDVAFDTPSNLRPDADVDATDISVDDSDDASADTGLQPVDITGDWWVLRYHFTDEASRVPQRSELEQIRFVQEGDTFTQYFGPDDDVGFDGTIVDGVYIQTDGTFTAELEFEDADHGTGTFELGALTTRFDFVRVGDAEHDVVGDWLADDGTGTSDPVTVELDGDDLTVEVGDQTFSGRGSLDSGLLVGAPQPTDGASAANIRWSDEDEAIATLYVSAWTRDGGGHRGYVADEVVLTLSRAPEGCGSDSECLITERCVERDCVVRVDGDPCPSDNACPGDLYCAGEACQDGSTGDPCDTSTDCAASTELCDTTCRARLTGEACGTGDVCPGALYCADTLCRAGETGDACNETADCLDATELCDTTCRARLAGEACGTGDVCPNGMYCADALCRAGETGDPCNETADCLDATELCDTTCRARTAGEDCGTGDACPGDLYCADLLCRTGATGDACNETADCVEATDLCDTTCRARQAGEDCGAEDVCPDPLYCAADSVCYGGAEGEPCETELECALTGRYCDPDGICRDGSAGDACDATLPAAPLCGDGLCGEGESWNLCPGDCLGFCGDGVCDAREQLEEAIKIPGNSGYCAQDCRVTVIFELETTDRVPGELEGAWIVGNQLTLGDWTPNVVELTDDGVAPDTTAGDLVFTAALDFDPGTWVEYKYTIGQEGADWAGTEEYIGGNNRGFLAPSDGIHQERIHDVWAEEPTEAGGMGASSTVAIEGAACVFDDICDAARENEVNCPSECAEPDALQCADDLYCTHDRCATPGFAFVPAGTFDMGSPGAELGRNDDESPAHAVTLSRPFYMSTQEVTQRQWDDLMGPESNPSQFVGCADCPVEQLNWWEALAYLNALSVSHGLSPCYTLIDCIGVPGDDMECADVSVNATDADPYLCEGYRLPTEAEWEYAYRSGTTTAFYNGAITDPGCFDPNLDAIGWYCSGWTRPAGGKAPNAWGLYNMPGNVAEWVWDWYDSAYYAASSSLDPLGPETGSTRGLRGASWGDTAAGCRAAARASVDPNEHQDQIGIRAARTVLRCADDADCPSAATCDGDSSVCLYRVDGEECAGDDECPRNLYCSSEGLCRDGSTGDGCESTADCVDVDDVCDGTCRDRIDGDACASDDACPSGLYCASSEGICRDGSTGDACDGPADCDAVNDFCDVTCQSANFMFVTRDVFSPNFASDGDPFFGADEACNTAASDAGLAGNFVALLRTGDGRLTDRLSGARGWVRPDGLAVVDTIADLEQSAFFQIFHYDEHGVLIPGEAQLWTGGLVSGDNCAGWSTTDGGAFGTGAQPTDLQNMMQIGGANCDQQLHLLCAQIDHETAVTPRPIDGPTRLIFTAFSGAPRNGGLGDFDEACQAEFETAFGTETGRAFVALLGADGGSPGDRLDATEAAWERSDGALVAPSTSALLAETSETWWARSADGRRAEASDNRWGSTGITTPGTPENTCQNWTSIDSGDHSGTNGSRRWLTTFGKRTLPCSSGLRHHCAEVRPDVCSSGCTFTSIQAAIDAAAPNDTIRLGRETFTESDITISVPVRLVGLGSSRTIVQAAATVDEATERVFNVPGGVEAEIESVTIRHGNGGASPGGGGIYNQGTLTLRRCVVADNHGGDSSSWDGGSGGGILSTGTLTIEECTIRDNRAGDGASRADDWGGDGGLGGGIRVDGGSVTLVRSTVVGNVAGQGGDGCDDFDGDVSPFAGQGGEGGGMALESSTALVLNSTFVDNETGAGGVGHPDGCPGGSPSGGNGGGILSARSDLDIVHSTFTGNASGGVYGGGGVSFFFGTSRVRNSIFAENTSTNANADCFRFGDSSVTSLGYNLLQTPDGCDFFGAASNDVVGVDPELEELTDNGGPTETRLPSPGSPVIDAVPIESCVDFDSEPIAIDQRREARPAIAQCDIGAVELGPPSLPLAVTDWYALSGYFSEYNADSWDTTFESEVPGTCATRGGAGRGDCMRITYNRDPDGDGAGPIYSGWYWQYPANNWGQDNYGDGQPDLGPGFPIPPGATEVSFYAWGETGDERVNFKAGINGADGFDITSGVQDLTTTPTRFTIDISGSGYTDVTGSFAWVMEGDEVPLGNTSWTFYVDDVVYQ